MSGVSIRRLALAAAAALSLVTLVACEDTIKPTELEPLKPQIAGRMVWKHKFSGFPGSQAVAVAPNGTEFVVGASNGDIVALDAQTGAENWKGDAGAKLASGIGTDGRFVATVTRDGELVVLEKGKIRWQQRLITAVVTAPFVAGERVFVLGVDRSVQAWDVLNGSLLWTFSRTGGDALTLSQGGVLAAYKDTLLVGQGNRLTALDPLKGLVRWEAVVASPRGTNEVERLADLVGPVARVGSMYCVRAFQNGVGCVDADRATTVWSLPGSGAQAVAADDDAVFSADGIDRITARRRLTGETLWSSDKFQNRHLSGPVAAGKTVVFGDYKGWVHFLSRDTGAPLLRLETDGSPIVGQPARIGLTILVTTKDGGAFAFRPE
jgi:outer membrane assembly lipoprotein YfgL